MKTLKTIAALSLGATLAIAAPQIVSAHGNEKHGGDKGHHAAKGHKDQHVTVTVTNDGYSPSTVSVKAGQEVHMTFISKGESCANGIRIPALKQSINLKKGQKKEIVFTPKKGQTIAFACSMKMFKGKVVAR